MSSEKSIVNTVYHAVVISALSVGYAMIGKKALGMKAVDIGKTDANDAIKLVSIVSAAIFTKDYLVQQNIIPDNIMK
jgi:hypothetical protein